jgi:transglutaminase-like putative cysteine protease
MTARLRRSLAIPSAGIAAVLLPGALKLLLRAGLSWPVLVGLTLGKIALCAASIRLRGASRGLLRALSMLYSVGFSLAVLAGVLITPYSAYRIWFERIRDGDPGGVVSILVVLLAAVFSSSLARGLLRSEILLPLFGQLAIAAGVLALVYQTRLFYLLLLCVLALGPAAVCLRFVKPPNRLRNLAAFFLLFAAIAGLSALPLLFARPEGSRIVDSRLHPGLRRQVVALFPRFPLLYGIPGFGYGFENSRLGAAPLLSKAPILDIHGRTGQRLYLRTASYSTYDGRSWRRPQEPGSPANRAAGSEADEAVVIEALHAGELPPAFSLRITLLAEYYSLVPFTLNTRAIYLPAELVEGISGSFEEGFQLANPLRSGQSIYLESGDGPQAQGAPALSSGQSQDYLQLPDRLDPAVAELAGQLADPADTRRTLTNIESYLARNCTYNLEAERIPAGTDFVAGFLFGSREGYCVHFASAFIVLARLNGIPARYATGFLVTLPAGAPPFETELQPGRAVVTGLSAHAWPEVWLPEGGWTTWEATTAVNPAYYERRGEELRYEYRRAENRLTDRQLREILGRPVSRDQEGRLPSVNWQILLLLVPVLALLAALWWAARRYAVLLLAALRPDRLSALKLLGKIVSSRKAAAAEGPEKTGWVRWVGSSFADAPPRTGSGRQLGPARARSAQRSSRRARRTTLRLLEVIQRLAYSDQGFRRQDLRFLRAFYLKYCF